MLRPLKAQGTLTFRIASIIIIIIGFCASLGSCKFFEKVISDDQSESNASAESKAPSILLLNFQISSTDSIQLINSMASPGVLRNRNIKDKVPVEGDIVVSFYRSTNEKCYQTIVDNPLEKMVEYSEDFQTLTAKTVTLESAPFSIRVQLQGCMKYVVVERISQGNAKYLKTFELD